MSHFFSQPGGLIGTPQGQIVGQTCFAEIQLLAVPGLGDAGGRDYTQIQIWLLQSTTVMSNIFGESEQQVLNYNVYKQTITQQACASTHSSDGGRQQHTHVDKQGLTVLTIARQSQSDCVTYDEPQCYKWLLPGRITRSKVPFSKKWLLEAAIQHK